MGRLLPVEGVEAVDLPSGEAVARHPETGQALVLNAMGGVVFELCDGTLDAEGIAQVLHDRFPDTPLEQVRRDVQALVERLKEAGLVEERAGAGRAGR